MASVLGHVQDERADMQQAPRFPSGTGWLLTSCGLLNFSRFQWVHTYTDAVKNCRVALFAHFPSSLFRGFGVGL